MQKCKNAKMQKKRSKRAISCRIAPYRSISLLAQKNCCIFASRMRQKLQYPAVKCSLAQFSAVKCSLVQYRAV